MIGRWQHKSIEHPALEEIDNEIIELKQGILVNRKRLEFLAARRSRFLKRLSNEQPSKQIPKG